jgi:CheY-like chemotaxis protein
MSLKIMVVDDEPLSLKVMRSLAVPLGHTVLTFDDSQKATQQAEKQRFDVVFLGMPRPDGLELAGRIRNSPPNSGTTFVMLSAMNDMDMLRKALGEGVTYILPKPITAARIIPMLTALESPGWKNRRHDARLPLTTEVTCKCGDRDFPMTSMNISEAGMLLKSTGVVEVGEEVALEFEIAEVHASLNVRARVVRKEKTDCVGMEFIGLAPEDQNAIHLYVMGGMKGPISQRDLAGINMRRLFRS